jgi:hypothetical protein
MAFHIRIFLLAAVLALPYPTPGAGDSTLDRATLRGLKAVNIVIDRLDPVLEDAGLTPSVLESRVGARLEKAGITVDRTAVEFLGLRIMQVRGKHGPLSLCLGLGLYQPVVLVRDKDIKTATQTWEVDTVLMAAPKSLRDAALSSVDELADGFAAAWHSVNE